MDGSFSFVPGNVSRPSGAEFDVRVRARICALHFCPGACVWCLVLSWRLFDFITSPASYVHGRMCMGGRERVQACTVAHLHMALRGVVRCSEFNADVCVCLESCSVPALR